MREQDRGANDMRKLDLHSKGRVVVTDPDLLASLRLSPEAVARIERLERAQRRPGPRIVLGG